MSLYRREGSPFWWYTFTVDGVRFRGSTGEAGKREAGEVEREKYAEAKKKPRYGDAWKWRYASGAYWNDHAVRLRSSKTIEYQLDALSRILGKDTAIAKLTAANVISYRAKRRGEGLSDASINREIEILRAALNHAAKVHNQQVPVLPWDKLMGKEPPGRTRFLSHAEFERLKNAAHESIRPILLCAVTTGLRKENILALDWMQVALQQGFIHVIAKGNKRLSIKISAALRAALSTTPEEKRIGRVFNRTNFEKRWRTAVKDSKLSDLRFHDLRHTFASWARQAGADIADVKEAMGHSDISMTMRYAHIKADEHLTAFDRVSEIFLSQNSTQKAAK